MKKLTLSDFANMDIVRDEEKAELIFDYYRGRPVRLIGFQMRADEKDWDVRENGYMYWRELLDRCGAPGANLY